MAGSSVNYMRSVIRKRSPKLTENFSRTTFLEMLSFRSVPCDSALLESLTEAGIICPREEEGRSYYHRGHLLLVYGFQQISRLDWHDWEMSGAGSDELLIRRSQFQKWVWQLYLEDVRVVNRFFNWIWSNDISAFAPTDAAHINALIDIILDRVDSDGFIDEVSGSFDGQLRGIFLLIKELLAMQSELGRLLSDARDAGIPIGDVQRILTRLSRIEEKKAVLCPASASYIVTPGCEITAEERLNFMERRNQLILDEDWEGLATHYSDFGHYFESDMKLHEDYLVCLGDLMGGRCHQPERAIECFEAVLGNNEQNTYAFDQLRYYLRQAERWQELSDLLSNHWDSIRNLNERASCIYECAEIMGFELGNYERSLELYERCFVDGCACDEFEKLSTILTLGSELPVPLKMRGIAILSAHIRSDEDADYFEKQIAKIQSEGETSEFYLVNLAKAGLEVWKGHFDEALGLVRASMQLSPRDQLWVGMMHLVYGRQGDQGEEVENIEEFASADLDSSDFSVCMERLGDIYLHLNKVDLALGFYERAVLADTSNHSAPAKCIAICERLGRTDKVFLYSTLLYSLLPDGVRKAELENSLSELRLKLESDEAALTRAYEQMLGFSVLRDEAERGILEQIGHIRDNDEVLRLLNHVEEQSGFQGQKELVIRLYAEVLERDIDQSSRKELLERYLGLLLGQSDPDLRGRFLEMHAQLFAIACSDRLMKLLKSFRPSREEAQTWSSLLEDAISELADKEIQVKTLRYLGEWVKTELKDDERCACIYEKILADDASDAETFRECYACYERLGRQFECVGLVRGPSLKYLDSASRVEYARKALKYALVNMGDNDAISEIFGILYAENSENIGDIVNEFRKWAKEADISLEQLGSIWDSVTSEKTGSLFCAARMGYIEDLMSSGKKAEALALMDDALKQAVEPDLSLFERVTGWIQNCSGESLYDVTAQRFGIVSAKTEPLLTPVAPAKSVLKQETAPEPAPVNGVEAANALLEKLRNDGETEDWNQAIEAVIKQSSDSVGAGRFLVSLSGIYEEKGMLDKSETWLKKAFALNQSNLDFVSFLAEFYKRNGMMRKAVKMLTYKVAKETTPERIVAATVDLANCQEELGDIEQAVVKYEDVIKKYANILSKPSLVQFYRKLANLQLNCGDLDAAIASLKSASSASDIKSREEIDTDCCFLLREAGKTDDAKKLWQSLKLRGAKNIRMELLALSFDVDAGKYEESRPKVKEYLSKEEWQPYRLLLLENLLRIQEQTWEYEDEVIATCKEILELNPRHSEALKHLVS